MKNEKGKILESASGTSKRLIIDGAIIILALSLMSMIFVNFYLSRKISQITSGLPQINHETTHSQNLQKNTIPDIIYNLAGSIKKIEDKTFLMAAAMPQLDENNKPVVKTELKKIFTSSTTKFSYLTFVSKDDSGSKTPEETQISFTDLKIGDYVEVISNKNVKGEQEVEATKIRVLSSGL